MKFDKYEMYESLEKIKEEEHKQYLKFKKMDADQFLGNEKGYAKLLEELKDGMELEIEVDGAFGIKKISGKYNSFGGWKCLENADGEVVFTFKQEEFHKIKNVKIKGDN